MNLNLNRVKDIIKVVNILNSPNFLPTFILKYSSLLNEREIEDLDVASKNSQTFHEYLNPRFSSTINAQHLSLLLSICV